MSTVIYLSHLYISLESVLLQWLGCHIRSHSQTAVITSNLL